MNWDEPVEYEVEFFYSKKEKVITTIVGFFLIFIGLAVAVKDSGHEEVPIVLIIGGIFFAYMGVREIVDNKPKLKLARKGLWTKKLGFVDWKDIAKAEVVEAVWGFRQIILKRWGPPQIVLKIYLKIPGLNEADQPDELLDLTFVENKQYVEMLIDDFMSKRNEPKHRAV